MKAKILDTLQSIGKWVVLLALLSVIVEVLLMALYAFSLIAFGLEKEPPIILLTMKCMKASLALFAFFVFMMLISVIFDFYRDLYRKIKKRHNDTGSSPIGA